MPDYLTPEDVDRRFRWRAGRAARLAQRGAIPCYVLPDGEVRFLWDELAALIQRRGPLAPGAALAPAAPIS